jgi:hypothetical protein
MAVGVTITLKNYDYPKGYDFGVEDFVHLDLGILQVTI